MDHQRNGSSVGFAQRLAELDRAHRGHRPKRHRSLVLHWLWSSLRRPRAVEHTPLLDPAPSQLAVTFAGHASVLLRFASVKIALDPILRTRLGPFGVMRRTCAPGLRARDLADSDVVLVSSLDPAHLDLATLACIKRSSMVIVPRGGAAKISELGFSCILESAPGQTFSCAGVDIATYPSHCDDYAGLSFVLRGDAPTVFFCGRTGYGPTFRQVGQEQGPDLALLPIGGYWPRSFRRRHLSPLDALYAFEDLRSRLLVPIHLGGFAVSYERASEPTRWLANLVSERGLDNYVVGLAPGETRLFTNPSRARRPTPHAHMDSARIILGNAR